MKKLNTKIIDLHNQEGVKILSVFKGDYFTAILDQHKVYEQHFTDFLYDVLLPGDVALDLGANLGYHTINMANIVGRDGQVHAFEAQRIIFQQLTCNVFLNQLTNVYTYNNAIGNSFESVFIEDPNYFHDGTYPNVTNIGNSAINLSNRGNEVKQLTINSLNLSKLNFIKLDIQGSELMALQGGVTTIEKFQPYIFIEIENEQLQRFNIGKQEIIDFFKVLKYSTYRITNTDDYICLPEHSKYDINRYKNAVEEIE